MDTLPEIFNTLKPLLAAYAPPFIPKRDEPGYYDLWSIKNLVIEGRKRSEIYFGAIIIQKSYVGFYFMPVYTDADLKPVFAPELLKLLKGKSCFHIRQMDERLLEQVRTALQDGFALYQAREWV